MSKNNHNLTSGSTIERSDERIDFTGEVFTPMEVCEAMVNDIPESVLKNPNSTFLDNSAGAGNFMVALQTKLQKYHSLQHINNNMLLSLIHISEPTRQAEISYAVFCLKKKI